MVTARRTHKPKSVTSRPKTTLAAALDAGADHRDRDIQDKIRLCAYRLYERRGCEHGNDINDWLRAEREVLSETARINQQP